MSLLQPPKHNKQASSINIGWGQHLASILVYSTVAAFRQHAGLEAARQQSGEAQISDLDLTRVAVDVDLVASQIPVDDGRRLAVEVQQPQEHLP